MTSFNCVVDGEGAQYSLVPLLELKEAYEYTIPVTIPSSVLRHYSRRSESSLPGVGISEEKNVLHKSPVFLLTPGLHSMLAPAKELPLAARCKPRPPPVLQWAAWRSSSDTLGCSFMDCLHNLCHVPESVSDSSFSHAPSAECIFELFCLCGRVR